MTPHTHTTRVPGCYRCELSRDEALFAEGEQAGYAMAVEEIVAAIKGEESKYRAVAAAGELDADVEAFRVVGDFVVSTFSEERQP